MKSEVQICSVTQLCLMWMSAPHWCASGRIKYTGAPAAASRVCRLCQETEQQSEAGDWRPMCHRIRRLAQTHETFAMRTWCGDSAEARGRSDSGSACPRVPASACSTPTS